MNSMHGIALSLGASIAMLAACSSSGGSSSGSAADTASALGASGPDSDNWCHDGLQSTDGTQIRFDYQVQNTTPSDKTVLSSNASPAYVNVQGNFTGSENVTVVVIDYTTDVKDYQAGYGTLTQSGPTQSLPMTWDSDHFSVQVTNGLGLWSYAEGDDDATIDVFQFAVVVDNNWLTDPVSGQHNFQYVPSTQAAQGCNGFVD